MPITERVVQGCLYLVAVGVFLAGLGRMPSIAQVGLPKPARVWLTSLVPELVLPLAIVACQFASR